MQGQKTYPSQRKVSIEITGLYLTADFRLKSKYRRFGSMCELVK
jgi:hypothetical protein